MSQDYDQRWTAFERSQNSPENARQTADVFTLLQAASKPAGAPVRPGRFVEPRPTLAETPQNQD